MLGLILAVLAFDFVNNATRAASAGEVFIRAITFLPQANRTSYGILLMMVGTLILGVALVLAELRRSNVLRTSAQVSAAAALMTSIGLFLWVLMGTFIGGDWLSSPRARRTPSALSSLLPTSSACSRRTLPADPRCDDRSGVCAAQ